MRVVEKTSKATPWGGSPSESLGQGTRNPNIHTPAQTAVATAISGPGRTTGGSFWARAGAVGLAAVGSAGRPAVTAASSARVRAANAWPTRRSNSSLASRPWTNAALSTSITCSRSA